MTPDVYHRGQNDKPTQEREDLIGIDWLSITGKSEYWAECALAVLTPACEGTPEVGRGRFNYREGLRWPCGVTMFRGHDASAGMVEIAGGACRRLGGKVLHQLGASLMMGGHCTRLDIRRDLIVPPDGAERIGLIGDVVAACKAGELCRVRGFKTFEDRDALTQEVQGEGVYLGSTKSPRFVRVYDKGQEQETMPRGCWVRFEGQFREEFANVAAAEILGNEDWGPIAAKFLLGVVDFRTEPSNPHLERRPLSPFWRDFCGSIVGVRTRLDPEPSSLPGFLKWHRRSIWPTIHAAAQQADATPGELVRFLMHGTTDTDAAWKNPITFELAAAFREWRANRPV